MHHFYLWFHVLFICFGPTIPGDVPTENNRLNSILHNGLVPLPSMYLPLNCEDFKQKGLIAWIIHEGLDVPSEDRILFEKCGNVDKDYIVGETFIFGERNVAKMKQYSSYLRHLLRHQKPKEGVHQSKVVSKDANRLFQHLNKKDTFIQKKVHHSLYKDLYRPVVFLSVLLMAITLISAIVTIFTFINYHETSEKNVV